MVEISQNNNFVNNVMRQIVTMLDVPVKVVLIVLLIISLIMVGGLIAEYFQRKYLNVKAASVVDAIKKGINDPATIIKNDETKKTTS